MTTELEEKADEARKLYESYPNLSNLIWYGRRIAYTGDFEKAIQIYSEGLEKYPDSPKLYRHRGHRYISTKQFDNAITDFKRAKVLIQDRKDVVEKDGMPNDKDIPLSTLHFNIYYHLGLSYYLVNDLDKAYKEYRSCLEVSKNDDSIIACKYWLYLITQKMDQFVLFVPPDNIKEMEIIENTAYYYLLQLFLGIISEEKLLDKVENSLDEATVSYGLAMWYYFNGDHQKAQLKLQKSIKENNPAAFGTLAAETELEKL